MLRTFRQALVASRVFSTASHFKTNLNFREQLSLLQVELFSRFL